MPGVRVVSVLHNVASGKGAEFAMMEVADQHHHPQRSTRITGERNACVISRDGQVSLRLGSFYLPAEHSSV